MSNKPSSVADELIAGSFSADMAIHPHLTVVKLDLALEKVGALERELMQARDLLAASTVEWLNRYEARERQVEVLREALEAYRKFKPFDWRFDHSGAMNATQMGEQDRYLAIRKQADAALSEPPTAPPQQPGADSSQQPEPGGMPYTYTTFNKEGKPTGFSAQIKLNDVADDSEPQP